MPTERETASVRPGRAYQLKAAVHQGRNTLEWIDLHTAPDLLSHMPEVQYYSPQKSTDIVSTGRDMPNLAEPG